VAQHLAIEQKDDKNYNCKTDPRLKRRLWRGRDAQQKEKTNSVWLRMRLVKEMQGES